MSATVSSCMHVFDVTQDTKKISTQCKEFEGLGYMRADTGFVVKQRKEKGNIYIYIYWIQVTGFK